MNFTRRATAASGLICLAASGLALVINGPVSSAAQSAGGSQEPTPAYHSQVPAGPLAQTMDPTSFANPVVQNAYALAAKVKRVLYQQPCYCHCDKSIGHESLLDCFVGKHASVCDVCMREDFYAYEQTQKKKTAAQIRAGIERGEWQQVDLSKYETVPPKP
jgi:hypothetical protein